MIEKIVSYLKFGNRFYGVEHTQINGEEIFYGLVLKRKKEQLYIEKNFETNTINDLKIHIPKSKAVSLVINTNAVLTKRVQSKTNDIQKLVYLTFPNIKVKDFYYEIIAQREYQFVSICRKSYVDDLLDNYISNGITVIDFTLGNLAASTLSRFIDTDEIRSSNTQIILRENEIVEFIPKEDYSESIYTINGLDIKNTLLLSFVVALNLLAKNNNTQSGFVEKKAELNTIFNEKLFANQFLKIGLSVLFLILLINFLFFNHYYKEVNSLKETAQVLQASKVKMISLNEQVQKSEKMVNDILKSSSSKSSFYTHVIVNRLPESILLEEFNYQPLAKKVKEGKSIESHENTIVITGQTKARVMFSQWIYQLEAVQWISSVNIISYKDINTVSSKFTIKLQINDEAKN